MTLIRKHITLEGNRTSIALEPLFWMQAEAMAKARGINCNEWVSQHLKTNKVGGRASALRLAILEGAMNN